MKIVIFMGRHLFGGAAWVGVWVGVGLGVGWGLVGGEGSDKSGGAVV